MANLLTRKLEAFAPLPQADKRLLDEVSRDARAVGPRTDLIREGDTPSDVNLILEGVGGITESDVMLAAASDAVVLGFNVRPVGDAAQVADRCQESWCATSATDAPIRSRRWAFTRLSSARLAFKEPLSGKNR